MWRAACRLPATNNPAENLQRKDARNARRIIFYLKSRQSIQPLRDIQHCQFFQHLLDALLADPYFRLTPPKSNGREYFNMDWLATHAQVHELPVQDVQATLCELTVLSIAAAIAAHAPATRRLLVYGGGVHNVHLLRRLEQALPQMNVESTGMHGLDPDWVEAVAFAWLARQTIEGKPGNLPAVTGAARPVVLGKLFRKRARQTN